MEGQGKIPDCVSHFSDMREHGTLSAIGPLGIIDSLSRSYRHELIGIDLIRDSSEFLSGTNACVPDLDFIPRRSTSAAVVVQGVPEGGNPLETVMWAALGYPAVSVTVPVPVSEDDCVPEELSCFPESVRDSFCGLADFLSYEYVYYPGCGISNHSKYIGLRFVLGDTPWSTSTLACSRRAEAIIKGEFLPLYRKFCNGGIDGDTYIEKYRKLSENFFRIYQDAFECYIHWKGPFIETF